MHPTSCDASYASKRLNQVLNKQSYLIALAMLTMCHSVFTIYFNWIFWVEIFFLRACLFLCFLFYHEKLFF